MHAGGGAERNVLQASVDLVDRGRADLVELLQVFAAPDGSSKNFLPSSVAISVFSCSWL